jgi:hypothetical protein
VALGRRQLVILRCRYPAWRFVGGALPHHGTDVLRFRNLVEEPFSAAVRFFAAVEELSALV